MGPEESVVIPEVPMANEPPENLIPFRSLWTAEAF